MRPARPREYDQVFDLIGWVSGRDAGAIAAATVQNDPRFRPELLRVVERDGQLIGALHVIDRPVHIGMAQVRCAIVAPLVVAP